MFCSILTNKIFRNKYIQGIIYRVVGHYDPVKIWTRCFIHRNLRFYVRFLWVDLSLQVVAFGKFRRVGSTKSEIKINTT
jgi:hypothetical protein